MWDILSLIKNLPEKRNYVRSEDLSFKMFGLKRAFCLCLWHLNLTVTWLHFFKWWHEYSCSGVTLTQVSTKLLKHSPPKFHPQDLLEQVLFQVFLFCDIENLPLHSFPAKLSFVTDDYYSFLISILNKLCHILTQNLWTFRWVLKVLMTHLIIWAVLQQPYLYSCFLFDL